MITGLHPIVFMTGNTVTGLIEVDLNSPEPDPASYGPWPVNRFVHGLDGNAGICKLCPPQPF